MRGSRPSRWRRAAAPVMALFALGAGVRVGMPAEAAAGHPIAEAFPLIFDAEWVRLDVDGDRVEVQGTFLLVCREPVDEPTPVFFPFPVDSLLGPARMVSLVFRTGADPLVPGRWEEVPGMAGVRWWLPPCPGDSLVAEFVYRQELRAAYARYILTTARLWGRPLRYAEFEIRLPAGAEPTEFSYPFKRREDGRDVRYVYKTEELFPDRDIVVRWRRAAPSRSSRGAAPARRPGSLPD